MSRSSFVTVFTVVLAISGCIGSDDGPDSFELCGNGTVDAPEECDDGFPPPTPSAFPLGEAIQLRLQRASCR